MSAYLTFDVKSTKELKRYWNRLAKGSACWPGACEALEVAGGAAAGFLAVSLCGTIKAATDDRRDS